MRLLAIALLCGLSVCVAPAAFAQAHHASAPVAEARVNALVVGLSAGDPASYEAAAQANFSAAQLARRTPEQRAEFSERVFGDFGVLRITNLTQEGQSLRADLTGASGATATLTVTFDGTPDQKVDGVRFELSGH